jgi:hypothetical protein
VTTDDTDRRQRRAGLAILSAIRPMIAQKATEQNILSCAQKINFDLGYPLTAGTVRECVATEMFWATRRGRMS